MNVHALNDIIYSNSVAAQNFEGVARGEVVTLEYPFHFNVN